MTRKLIVIIVAMLLALSACAPGETPTNESISPTIKPVEDVLEPTPYPDIEQDVVNELVEDPTPYPEPEVYIAYPEPEEPAQVQTGDPYPGPEEVDWPLIITDDLGNTIELSAYPQAIVSISPSMTEILFAIGAGDQLVGRDDLSLYPEAAIEVESIGSLWEGVPTEPILALEPDLVVAAEIISEENVQVLIDLGLPVYWQANPIDFDDLYENLMDIAEITGHTEDTVLLVTDLENRVDAVVEIVGESAKSTCYFLRIGCHRSIQPLDDRFWYFH